MAGVGRTRTDGARVPCTWSAVLAIGRCPDRRRPGCDRVLARCWRASDMAPPRSVRPCALTYRGRDRRVDRPVVGPRRDPFRRSGWLRSGIPRELPFRARPLSLSERSVRSEVDSISRCSTLPVELPRTLAGDLGWSEPGLDPDLSWVPDLLSLGPSDAGLSIFAGVRSDRASADEMGHVWHRCGDARVVDPDRGAACRGGAARVLDVGRSLVRGRHGFDVRRLRPSTGHDSGRGDAPSESSWHRPDHQSDPCVQRGHGCARRCVRSSHRGCAASCRPRGPSIRTSDDHCSVGCRGCLRAGP